MNELPKIVPIQTPNERMTRFLLDLDAELAWEWKWEKLNRRWTWGIHWAGWGARLILLAVAAYQLSIFDKGPSERWLVALIALFSMLNVALPLISFIFRFPQRQEIHDRTARAHDVIRVELRAEQISLVEAVDRYKKIREQPNESLVRETP